MNKTIEITYSGIPLLVEGEYIKGIKVTGYYDVEEPDQFYINQIFIADSQINVIDLFLIIDDEATLLDLIFEEIEK